MKEKLNKLKNSRNLLYVIFFISLSCLTVNMNILSQGSWRGEGTVYYTLLIVLISVLIILFLIFSSVTYYLYETRRDSSNNLYEIEKIFFRLPIEIKIFSILVLDFVSNENIYSYMGWYIDDYYRMLLSPRFIIAVLMQAILFGTIYLFIKYIIYLFKNHKNNLKEELLRDSLVYKYWDVTSELYFKGEKIKRIRVVFGVMLVFGAIIGVFASVAYYAWPFMVAFLFIIVLYHTLKIYKDLKDISNATYRMAQGDLNVNIPEKGDVLISNLAKNINNVNKGFRDAVNKEIKSEKMKGELITNVSHDLKTPLTSIINYVDLLKDEDLPIEKRMEYIDILDKKSKRLKILIEDLFEASKAASGSMELEVEKVDIVALIRQTIGEFTDKIDESKLDFKVNVPQEKIYLMLDGKKTWRVFENLITNALKYSLKGSRVYIDLFNNNDEVILTIKNISAYEMNFTADEIVERFTRGDSSRNTEGSGLGLAISKSIIDLQGGKFDINVDGDLFKVCIRFNKKLI